MIRLDPARDRAAGQFAMTVETVGRPRRRGPRDRTRWTTAHDRARPTPPGADAGPGARPRGCRYFFPAHNEEANLEGLVEEALETLPALADTFEIIVVNDGSRDATREIADRLAAAHPDVVRAVHHPTNLGYGGGASLGLRGRALRPARFTDGDRQFKVADLGRLIDRLAEPDQPDVVVGLPHQARRPARSGSSTPAPTGSPTGSSSACGSATSTAPASSSGATRSRASGSSRAARSSRPSC